jgi:uncharacterized protein HemX
MDNQIKAPISLPTTNSKTIKSIIILLIVIGASIGIYFIAKRQYQLNKHTPSTYEEKLRALEALRVTPTNGAPELTEAEKAKIMQDLRVKTAPVKGAKTLTPSEIEAIRNSLE